jgi:hypothetical protein
MDFTLDLKVGTKIFTIENCKIEEYFIEDICIGIDNQKSILNTNLSNFIYLKLERYNDGVNSCKTIIRLSQCFLTKDELLKQL